MQPLVPIIGLTSLFTGLAFIAASLEPAPVEPNPEWVILEGPVLDFRVVDSEAADGSVGGGPFGPTGENAEGDALCCKFNDPPCSDAPGEYETGDSVYLNYYWQETLPADLGPNWFVELSPTLRLPNGVQFDVLGEPSTTLDFGGLSLLAGETLEFCVGVLAVVPELPADFGPIGQGLAVSSIQGSFERTNVNSLSVN